MSNVIVMFSGFDVQTSARVTAVGSHELRTRVRAKSTNTVASAAGRRRNMPRSAKVRDVTNKTQRKGTSRHRTQRKGT